MMLFSGGAILGELSAPNLVHSGRAQSPQNITLPFPHRSILGELSAPKLVGYRLGGGENTLSGAL